MGRHPIIGAWVVRGKSAGICVREDVVATTNDNSGFVPHIVAADAPSLKVTGARNKAVNGLYMPVGRYLQNALYEKQCPSRSGGDAGGGGNSSANEMEKMPMFFMCDRGYDGVPRWMFSPVPGAGLEGDEGVVFETSVPSKNQSQTTGDIMRGYFTKVRYAF